MIYMVNDGWIMVVFESDLLDADLMIHDDLHGYWWFADAWWWLIGNDELRGSDRLNDASWWKTDGWLRGSEDSHGQW